MFVRGVAATLLMSSIAWGQGQDFSKVKIEVEKVSSNIAMLKGAGGNLGVSYGPDGVFVIDDQYAPMSKKISEAIKSLTKQPVKYVFNTHWHEDHTGGNEEMAKKGSVIVAHENVRKRMSTEQFIGLFQKKVPASPTDALPVITFDSEINFYLNGEDVEIFHVEHAHTDGDSIVYFKKSNILHMGDTYFNGNYPFIDVSSGGSVNGLIKAIEKALTIANNKTKIIPGHGALSHKKELISYLEMLKKSRDNIASMLKSNKSLDEIIKAQPNKSFDEGWGKGFIKPDVYISLLHSSLTKK